MQYRPDIDVIRAGEPYSLPASIGPYVSFVGELLRLPAINRPQVVNEVKEVEPEDTPFSACGSACSGYTTPEVLKQR